MLEIEQNKNVKKEPSTRVNMKNASNVVFGGQKEVQIPNTGKRVNSKLREATFSFNQHSI